MAALKTFAALLAIACLGQLAHAQQAPLTNACQTQFGVCFVGVAPAGAPCACIPAPNALHPGRMVLLAPPPAYVQAQPRPQPISNACGTRLGVCPVMPAPVGSACACGADPGQVIFFK